MSVTPPVDKDLEAYPVVDQEPDPDRITVVESVYFQTLGQQPKGIHSRFYRHLATKQKPFIHSFTATETWQGLETGWLETVGMLVITNNSPKNTLLINYKDSDFPGWLIPPKESMRGCPSDPSSLRVLCLPAANQPPENTSADFTVYLLPP